jgi:hypothetical protein
MSGADSTRDSAHHEPSPGAPDRPEAATSSRLSGQWKRSPMAFAMPIEVGRKDEWQVITPTTEWQTMTVGGRHLDKAGFSEARGLPSLSRIYE